MDRPPFRFAVQATNAAGQREWRDTVRKVEDLGYSTLFLADHYLGPGPAQKAARTPRQDLAPIAAMAAAAAYTETLRIGCRVFCIDYHVPAVLAKETATLDLLSDGRLEMGIGAGWSEVEYTAMGLDFDRPGRRIAKLAEVVSLIKAHWQGEELDYSGEFVEVRGYAGRPRPVQTAETASADHDRWRWSARPFVRRPGSRHRQHLQRAVRGTRRRRVLIRRRSRCGGPSLSAPRPGSATPVSTIETSPYFTEITDDPEAFLATVAKSTGIAVDLLGDHPNVLVGSLEGVVDKLHSRREILGVNYVTVQQSQIESFAPVVALLHGR